MFFEAQQVREEILLNGGTSEEAQKAYLEKISTTRKTIESIGEKTSNVIEEPSEPLDVNQVTENSEVIDSNPENNETGILVNVDGTIIEVDYKESVFKIEINGKILEFTVEDDQLIQINN